jgi:hypothetical protein
MAIVQIFREHSNGFVVYRRNSIGKNVRKSQYNPEVFQNSKIDCLREIRIFIGSGRSQIWINRFQINPDLALRLAAF